MKAENSVNFSKEIAVASAKKLYTTPVLKIYGAVSELTNGGSGSCNDYGSTRNPTKKKYGSSCYG